MSLHVISSSRFMDTNLVIYKAEDVGDGLPLHSHTFNHLTVAMVGAIEVYTDDGKSLMLNPGDLPVEYLAGTVHGIRAVTPGAIFMNVMPFGQEGF